MADLIPIHGGYRNLKSFQTAQVVYDVTVRFVERYVSRFSRTTDQMVQAARSGVQNIAEGSMASATSKKTELKLTQVARASLEELRLDYEDFLRHRGMVQLPPDHPVLVRFKSVRPQNLAQFRQWVHDEYQRQRDCQGQPLTSGQFRESPKSPCESLGYSCLAANGALSLINLACYLLDRQVARLAKDFETEGGFTERLYRIRKEKRDGK